LSPLRPVEERARSARCRCPEETLEQWHKAFPDARYVAPEGDDDDLPRYVSFFKRVLQRSTLSDTTGPSVPTRTD